MTADVIDNRQIRLAERVRELLADGATGMRLAVGYLFLDGLTPLGAQIGELREMQILIGNVVNRLTEEQVREEAESRLRGGESQAGHGIADLEDFASGLRETHTRSAAVTALNLRRTIAEMPREPAGQALLLTLAARIADGALKVRLYTHGRIHAKLALLEYPDAGCLGIVGSSNLTLGQPGHPTELNVVVRDPESVADLEQWYRRLWETSQDFHRELFEELGQCWAMRSLPLSGRA